MDDAKSASLVLIIGAIGIGWWFFNLNRGNIGKPDAKRVAAGSSPPPGNGRTPLQRLEAFAAEWGLTITSRWRNQPGSLHYEGRAIDVSPPGTAIRDAIRRAARMLGINILEEEYSGMGPYGRSTGPHWHFSISPEGSKRQ